MIKWTEKEIKILEDNYSKIGPTRIQELLPRRTYTSIKYQAHEKKISKQRETPSLKWTKQEIKILEDNYSSLGPTKIQELLPGRTKKGIINKAFVSQITTKSSHIKNYFKETSKFQPFIAGFIAADGCIHQHKNGGQKIISFNLQAADKDILEFIKSDFRYTGNICKGVYKNFNVPYVALRIYSANQLAKDLEAIYKITPRKTYTIEFPKLKTNIEIIKYIAGVFAGDGHARKSKRGYSVFQITSASKPFLDRLSEEVLRLIDYTGDKTYIYKNGDAWCFMLTGKNAEAWIKIMLKADFLKVPERKWKKLDYLGAKYGY